MRRLAVLLLVVACCCPPVLAVDVNNPPQGVFEDDWYAVMMDGAKSGHMHSVVERAKRDHGDVIKTTTDTAMTIGRGDVHITISVKEETEESLAGEPLKFSSRVSMGQNPTITEGQFSDGKVTVKTKQFGVAGEPKTYTLPKDALMGWGVYRQEMERGLKPGTSYKLSIYDPTTAPDKAITADVEVLDKEKIDLFGRKVEAIKTRQTIHLPGISGGNTAIATTTWMTEEGDVVRMKMKLMDIDLEMIACAKTAALAKDNPTDIMSRTLITVKSPLDNKAESITFRLEWEPSADQKPPSVPTTSMQKVVKQEGNSVTVTNTRYSARHSAHAGGGDGSKATPLSKEERERCLAAGPMVNYKDPVVAKLAKEAAGDEKDPHKLAKKLRRFVTNFVQTKDLSIGFASASEVARSKEGDCTEHGVLLAALGRAVGIPTRVVAGFVYVDEFLGQRRVFGGHLWTQFYIDSEWVDEDAALRQDDVDPTHIALAISDAGDNGMADLAGSVWMGKPKITVVQEVTDTPSKTGPAEGKQLKSK